ncbi:MAG: NHL repeat-containing protein [Planctomycetota bacterium]
MVRKHVHLCLKFAPVCWLGIALALPGCGGPASGAALTISPRRVWGGIGSTDGRFSLPRVIDKAHDGSIYVIDKTGRLQHFTADGAFLRGLQFPQMDNGKPTGMGMAPNGDLYIADTHNNRIDVYDRDLTLLRRWGSYGTRPGEFTYPTDVAVSAKGEVFVADYGQVDRVQKFDRQGKFLMEWGRPGEGPGEFRRPSAIALDGKGSVYVADTANHRVQKFTEDGKLLGVFGGMGSGPGRMKYPYDVIVGRDGMVYVCEYGNCRVQKFTPDGKSIGMWGMPGREPGMFAQPWGVAISGDMIHVADTENHRIQTFALTDIP